MWLFKPINSNNSVYFFLAQKFETTKLWLLKFNQLWQKRFLRNWNDLMYNFLKLLLLLLLFFFWFQMSMNVWQIHANVHKNKIVKPRVKIPLEVSLVRVTQALSWLLTEKHAKVRKYLITGFTYIMLRYFSDYFFKVDLCKVNSLLKPFSRCLAALSDWFIWSRDIKNRKFVGSNKRIKNMKIMKICVRIL